MNKFIIKSKDVGGRIDLFLTQKAGESRSYWQKQLSTNKVLVNGKVQKANYLVKLGDSVQAELAVKTVVKSDPPKLPVLYEDDDVIVINKPAGLLVHETPAPSGEPTVADFAATKSDDTDQDRPGIVHRLDRDTSGVMIIAKNTLAKAFLQEQFSNRTSEKTYYALVEGHLKQEEAVIDLPLGRKPDTTRYVPSGKGKPAETAYKVKEEYLGYSLLLVYPKTGRTHQIRAHFAALGHPVASDGLYGAKTLTGLSRQFLHAYQLNITLPSGKRSVLRRPYRKSSRQPLKSCALRYTRSMENPAHPHSLGAVKAFLDKPQGSWLFLGPPSLDWPKTIRQLAKSLHGHAKTTPDCLRCKQIDSGVHPDFYEISPSETGSIGIAQAHSLTRDLAASKYDAGMPHRIVVIYASDCLTPEAQNALLKLLEEPPLDAVIILIAEDSSKLLETVRSRCRSISFTDTSEALTIDDSLSNILEQTLFEQLVAAGKTDKTSLDDFIQRATIELAKRQREPKADNYKVARAQDALNQLKRNAGQNVAPRAALTAFFLELP